MKAPKTLKDLAKDAAARTLDRVQAESPSIQDTPRRRFAVFQAELASLAAEHHLPVLDAEIDDMAAEFAFGITKPLIEPEKAPEALISDEK